MGETYLLETWSLPLKIHLTLNGNVKLNTGTQFSS